MRELSACDFCGDEPSGVYEVVPGDIPSVSARRMVLCADCRDTLADIVDPLLAAGRRRGRKKSASADDTSASLADESTTKSPDASAAQDSTETPDGESSTPAGSGSSTADGVDGAEEEAAASTSASGDATGSGSTAAGESGEAGEAGAGDAGDEGEAADAQAGGSDAESGAGQQSEQKQINRPPNYGKVVRLVENRDAGIPREDLETLASSAYGIGPSEVEQAIETALTEGRFRETKDGLQTT